MMVEVLKSERKRRRRRVDTVAYLSVCLIWSSRADGFSLGRVLSSSRGTISFGRSCESATSWRTLLLSTNLADGENNLEEYGTNMSVEGRRITDLSIYGWVEDEDEYEDEDEVYYHHYYKDDQDEFFESEEMNNAFRTIFDATDEPMITDLILNMTELGEIIDERTDQSEQGHNDTHSKLSIQDLDLLPSSSDIAYFYLQNEIGLSQEDMWKVTVEAGSVLGMTVKNLKGKIGLLKRIMNLDDQDIRTILQRHPAVLHLSADKNVAPTILFLQRSLDFSREDLKTILVPFPSILGYSFSNLRSKINFYLKLMGYSIDEARAIFVQEPRLLMAGVKTGLIPRMHFFLNEVQFSVEDFRKIISVLPSILLMSVEHNLRPKLVFYFMLGLNMSPELLQRLLLKYPMILNYNLHNHILPITSYLATNLEFRDVEVIRILLKHPRFITHSLSKIKRRVAYLRFELGMDVSRTKRIIYQASRIMDVSNETLDSKVEYIRTTFQFTDEELRKVVSGMPTLLLCSLESNLSPKTEYLLRILGQKELRECILIFPTLLGYSLEKRIKPRMKQIIESKSHPRSITVGIPMKDDAFQSWLNGKRARAIAQPGYDKSRMVRNEDGILVSELPEEDLETSNLLQKPGIEHWTRERKLPEKERYLQGQVVAMVPNSESTKSGDDLNPKIEVLLSRSEYRLGSTVVGTIRLLPGKCKLQTKSKGEGEGEEEEEEEEEEVVGGSTRSYFETVQVCGVGRCRIDPRWHNPETYTRLYGDHPYLKDTVQLQSDSNEVVVWATNIVDIMDLEERRVGKWRDVKPKPLILPPDNEDDYFKEELYNDTDHHNQHHSQQADDFDNQHMLATFRADLPLDIPPSASVTCCRYYYSIIVIGVTSDYRTIFLDIPFTLLTPLGPTPPPSESRARVKYGTCNVMLHSSGLPCHVSADEIHAPRGQTTINRHNMLTSKPWDTKTLRITDPQGRPCCVLTAIGTSVMSPGTTLLLQFDFPLQDWVPCHHVSACLEGQEMAIHENRVKKARSHLFDAAHDFVEHGCTESIALKLTLPLDCPITMTTDLTKIQISCRIDLAVDGARSGTFTNLRLDLPVRVVHSVTSDEMDQEEDDPITPIDELIMGDEIQVETNPQKPASFETKDIMKELKILSLLLVDQCNLRI